MTESESVKQIKFILGTEKALGIAKASVMAKMLRVHYKTYSKWRNGENKMDAISKTALLMLMHMKTAKELDVHALDICISSTKQQEQANNIKKEKPL